jgi:hypothetical protein
MDYTALIEGRAIAALHVLLGHSLMPIYCPSLEVDGPVSRAPSFSFSLDDGRFINLWVRWDDTQRFYLDYWQLDAELSEAPRNIPYESGRRMFTDRVSQVLIRPIAPVIRIEIFQRHETRSDGSSSEAVTNDQALRFVRSDKSAVTIAAHRSIADLLSITSDPEAAATLTKDCVFRLAVEHHGA